MNIIKNISKSKNISNLNLNLLGKSVKAFTDTATTFAAAMLTVAVSW